MSVPDFQSLMLPVLHQLADGKERKASVVIEGVARELDLSDKVEFPRRASWRWI